MNTIKKRRQEKTLVVSGQVPTVPVVADHTTLGWLDTDIYIGEWCFNEPDGLWFSRNADGIVGPVGDTNTLIALITAETDARIANESYTHQQAVSASTWNITHNLGRKPSVTVIDSGGSECEGLITYTNSNSLTIVFSAAFSGEAYLN
jgi:hypothetical protein